MPPTTTIASSATGSARVVASIVTAPARISAAVLDRPRGASRDPASAALADLRRRGWRPSEVRFGPRRVEVDLERDGRHETVEGTTIAFAAYAGHVAVAAGAPVVDVAHR